MNEELVENLMFKWQQRLGLLDWDIRYAHGVEPAEGSRGTSNIWHAKRSVTVRIRQSAPDEVVEEIVLHELLHVVLAPGWDALSDALRRIASHDLYEGTKELADEMEETTIQHLTVAFLGHGVQCWDWGGEQPGWLKAFPVRSTPIPEDVRYRDTVTAAR